MKACVDREIQTNVLNEATLVIIGYRVSFYERFLNPNATTGRCEMTDLKTEFQSFEHWDTSPNPKFDVHLRHEYCPEQRMLTKNANSPVLALDPYPLYPAKQYYETNTLNKPTPDARRTRIQEQDSQQTKGRLLKVSIIQNSISNLI